MVQRRLEFTLVVDSHLDDLHKINHAKRRHRRLHSPLGVSIAYAVRHGLRPVLNALIAYCDRIAREVLSHATGPSSIALLPHLQAQRTPFRAYRYWKCD